MDAADFVLRLFVAALSEKDARAVAVKISCLIEKHCKSLTIKRLCPYWKIEGQFEILFVLKFEESAFSKVVESIGKGACKQRQWEVIWPMSDGCHFVSDEVRWAHLERID